MAERPENKKAPQDRPGDKGAGRATGGGESQPRRCRHCGKLILKEEVRERLGKPSCPHCGLPIEGVHLA